MKKSLLATIIVCVLALAVIATMLLVYFLAVVPAKTQGEKSIRLCITYANEEYEYDIKTNATTIAELITEQNTTLDLGAVWQEGAYGKFLTALKGVEQDPIEGAYYTYDVNGEYCLAIDVQTIVDGDVVTFKYGVTTYDDDWNATNYTLKDAQRKG